MSWCCDSSAYEEQVDGLSPADSASIYSRLTFSWLNPLLAVGRTTPLTSELLINTPIRHNVEKVGDSFKDAWQETIYTKDGTRRDPKIKNAFRAFLKTDSGRRLLIAGAWKIPSDALQFAGPVVLGTLLEKLQDESQPWYACLIWAGIFFVLSLSKSLALQQYFDIVYGVSMDVKTGICRLVFDKSLDMAPSTQQKATQGEVMNLMSIDAGSVGDTIPYGHHVWSAPSQIIIAFILLSRILGIIPAAAGLAIMFGLIPINKYLARWTGKRQEAVMSHKDERLKAMNELLHGVSLLKYFCWEKPYGQRVAECRDQEQGAMRRVALFESLNFITSDFSPALVICVSFGLFCWLGGVPTASVVFPALALFNVARFPIFVMPFIMGKAVRGGVAFKRLSDFLNSDDIDHAAPLASLSLTKPEGAKDEFSEQIPIDLNYATFDWEGKQESPTLKDITLKVPKGSLVAIFGAVGCGKTTLLRALFNDVHKISGDIKVSGSIGYCDQFPWIQNATVKQNLIGGADIAFDEAWYKRVLTACALWDDLSGFADGDDTEIGERGVTLSGGQKARLALARAVYRQSDIYLLDAILSAVDARVERILVEDCLVGILKDKTRILTTHSTSVLPYVDTVVVMEDGKIRASGTYDEVIAAGVDFAKDFPTMGVDTDTALQDEQSHDDSKKKSESKALDPASPGPKTSLVKDENRQTGVVGWEVYKYLLDSFTLKAFLVVVLFQVLYNALSVAVDVILSSWSSKVPNVSNALYLNAYLWISFVMLLVGILRHILYYFSALACATKMHNRMLWAVLHAPMSFFDSTPFGRLLNRFSKDQDTIDEGIQTNIDHFLQCLGQNLGVIAVVSTVTPPFLLVIPPLLCLFYYFMRYYRWSAREVTRLDNIMRSPIFSHFGETLGGCSTIRAHKLRSHFQAENCQRIRESNKAFWINNMLNRWLQIRLEAIGACVVAGACLFGVLARHNLPAALIGLSIVYALDFTNEFNWMVRMTVQIEAQMTGVERLKEIADLPPEADWENPSLIVPERWPQNGLIEWNNVHMKYSPDGPMVLKEVTFTIQAGERVGIVGRTGSGKSSLIACLMRLVEIADGQICIDGVDISPLGLHTVRGAITIIPQDPIMFDGTILTNLDPLGGASEERVWDALDMVAMKDVIMAAGDGLNATVTEHGKNFSAGQRQLLCMARALLYKSKIVVLDEATANVDSKTDGTMQATIRTRFSGCTIMCIAHRINTIIDYDKILVMDEGRVREFDTPETLLKDPNSLFYKLANASSSSSPSSPLVN